MRRREVLQLALAALLSNQALGFPVEKVLGPANSDYLRAYFDRLWRWYEAEFGAMEAGFLPSEKALFAAWKTHLMKWGLSLSSNQMFEHFLLSHKISGENVDHARFAMGMSAWPQTLKPALQEVLAARKVKAEEQPYGLGWNFSRQEFKVYSLHQTASDVRDPTLISISRDHSDENWFKQRISCVTYKNGKPEGRKLIVPMHGMDWRQIGLTPPWDGVAAMKIIDDSGRVRWHLRLRSFFFQRVGAAGHKLIARHGSEFHQLADSIIFEDRDHYTLYYP